MDSSTLNSGAWKIVSFVLFFLIILTLSREGLYLDYDTRVPFKAVLSEVGREHFDESSLTNITSQLYSN